MKIRTKKKAKRRDDSETSEDETEVQTVDTTDCESEDECLYCTQTWDKDKPGEKWMRCIKCLMWAHEICAGLNEKDTWKTFVCDRCFTKSKKTE